MTWWCAATRLPWSWSPRAYPGVWGFVAVMLLGAVLVVRRSHVRPTRRQKVSWVAGVVALWVASDWPLGTLGSGYLASAHMAQYFVYTFVATPLLVLAVPETLAERWVVGRTRTVYRFVSRPLFAAVVANIVLIGTHAPVVVDTFRSTQLGSFALDIAWLVGGVILWLPVCGPVKDAVPSYPVRCVYLFMAAGLVPMVPGGFLTFAEFPLYEIYELAPRVHAIDPLTDQQIAGALMKVGTLPLIWPIMGVMFWRFSSRDQAESTLRPNTAAMAERDPVAVVPDLP